MWPSLTGSSKCVGEKSAAEAKRLEAEPRWSGAGAALVAERLRPTMDGALPEIKTC